MDAVFKLTGRVTLLVGLQFVGLACFFAYPAVADRIQSERLSITVASQKPKPKTDDYEPPDKGSPSRTQGTGRRMR